MNLEQCFQREKFILMEGALGERLKREYRLKPDPVVALATMGETKRGRTALREIWGEYIAVAYTYHHPFLATTPTRRANRERISLSGFEDSIMNDNEDFLRALRAESRFPCTSAA